MFEKFYEEIKKYDSIILFGHINPDGDCYGSQIALRETLKLAFPDKEIFAVGHGFTRFFRTIGFMDEVDEETISKSLAIVVDANDLSRVENHDVYKAKAFAKIDHHVDTGSFKEGVQVLDENANSCAELVLSFIKEMNLPMNETIANALYLGILTDTGRFQFVNDFPKCFSEVTYLCEQGANPTLLNKVLNLSDESLLTFKSYVFSHYLKTVNGVMYCIINKMTLKEFNLTAYRASSMVNLLANIHGYPIWAVFCEGEDGSNIVEVRSNGPDIQPVCNSYGGGGHAQASGMTLPIFNFRQIEEIVLRLDQKAYEWRKNR